VRSAQNAAAIQAMIKTPQAISAASCGVIGTHRSGICQAVKLVRTDAERYSATRHDYPGALKCSRESDSVRCLPARCNFRANLIPGFGGPEIPSMICRALPTMTGALERIQIAPDSTELSGLSFLVLAAPKAWVPLSSAACDRPLRRSSRRLALNRTI
jgi:hypothetical protein